MFKIIVTHTNHVTGIVTTRTELKRYKTRRNAEKAADKIGYVCSTDGKAITMSIGAVVEEVNAEPDHDANLPVLSGNTSVPSKGDAATAVLLAVELQELWELHLDARLREANPSAGARFWTLINELNLATRRTERRYNRLLLKLEGRNHA
ncbi:hypothetical protein QFI91_20005 [Raoultella sp. WB_B2P2-3]|uniref:hypothetical protein n=1 Tax=Raoultella scottii TaxID=3040937 RepID=UPI002F94B36D